jgi:NADH-quinone oxidoreductase subunit N
MTIEGLGGGFQPKALAYQLPLLLLVLGGVAVLLFDAFAKGASRRWLMYVAAATCVGALAGAIAIWDRLGVHHGVISMYGGMLIADRYSTFFIIVFIAAAFLTLLLSSDFLREHAVEFGEYYALVLLSTAGMVMLAMAGDLVTVFLGIETMSVGVYVLTGSFRKSKRSTEAALKYFMTGAFATGFLFYGIALVYGMAGTTNLHEIAKASTELSSRPAFLFGEFMLIVAFGFKIAAVPFHMWAPDAYEGAPTPVTAFMSAGVKAAAFAAMLRIFLISFGGTILPFGRMGWGSTLGVIAAITMTLGNVAALRQENVKRLLAYSSISHAGYLLIGLVAAGVGEGAAQGAAVSAMLYYLLAYTFTTVGAFGVIAWLGSRGDERLMIDDWAGLASRYPGAALAMTIFMLSLGGMPPMAGFFGKFYVFRAAMQSHNDQLLWLVVVAVLNSVVSIFYYLRIVMAMYFREPAREPKPLRSVPVGVALVVAALFVVEMGVLPSKWLTLATKSALSLIGSGSP